MAMSLIRGEDGAFFIPLEIGNHLVPVCYSTSYKYLCFIHVIISNKKQTFVISNGIHYSALKLSGFWVSAFFAMNSLPATVTNPRLSATARFKVSFRPTYWSSSSLNCDCVLLICRSKSARVSTSEIEWTIKNIYKPTQSSAIPEKLQKSSLCR